MNLTFIGRNGMVMHRDGAMFYRLKRVRRRMKRPVDRAREWHTSREAKKLMPLQIWNNCARMRVMETLKATRQEGAE